MMRLGAYLVDAPATPAVLDDPRLGRLRSAWPAWAVAGTVDGRALVIPAGEGCPVSFDRDDYGEAVEGLDGLLYLPPDPLPELYDLAREDMPQPAARVSLRRVASGGPGEISIPLGLGPVYGVGPRQGEPSSTYGRLAWDLWSRVEELPTDDDGNVQLSEELLEDMRHLAHQAVEQGYHVTWELWWQLAVYDADELSKITDVIWGADPKAAPGDATT